MSDRIEEPLEFVVRRRRFRLSRSTIDERVTKLIVEVDGLPSQGLEIPSWRAVNCGVSGNLVYFWSARGVLVFRNSEGSMQLDFQLDEDILHVFSFMDAWILVCETSVRVCTWDSEISRTEFAEVLTEAQWHGDDLIVEDATGRVASMRFGPNLEVTIDSSHRG